MIAPSTAVRSIMAVALTGMGSLHFVPGAARGMAAIIPPSMKDRPLTSRQLVRLTGVCEIAGAAGLLWGPTRRAAALALIAFFAAVFPANVYASQHPEQFGRLAVPFVPRLIGQIALVGLAAFAGFGGPRR